MTPPLNPLRKKHRFSKAWMHEHVTDPYVREASRRGYRSRAAFKLQELAERDHLFRPGMTAVDLGAAPGSWSQVLRERLGPKSRIVAIDLLPMQALAGIRCIRADFDQDQGVAMIEKALGGAPVDLVVSDMSPNLSGIDVADQARSIRLAELALDFARTHLKPGGDLVVKVFQGAGLDAFQRDVRGHFTKTYLRKPKASRDRSREHFVVAKGLRPRIGLSPPGDKPRNEAVATNFDTLSQADTVAGGRFKGKMTRASTAPARAQTPRPAGRRPGRSAAARSIA